MAGELELDDPWGVAQATVKSSTFTSNKGAVLPAGGSEQKCLT